MEILNVKIIIGVVPIAPKTQNKRKRKKNPCTNNNNK
jgi:hypothetical protein